MRKRIFMLIERTNREVIIRLPASVDTMGLQRLIDYLTYKEATANSKATQDQVDKLARQVKKGWWKQNRKRLLK
jgi:predicted trehalose synthase